MPRVVLLATDPDLTVQSLAEQLDTWSGEPLEAVLVSLHPVAGTVTDPGTEPWADGTARDAAHHGVVGRSYEERLAVDAPATGQTPQPLSAWQRARARTRSVAAMLRGTSTAALSAASSRGRGSGPARRPAGPSSRVLRLRAEAAARARGVRLWEHVSADEEVARLVSGADAVAAVDLGAVRAAFHLAREHPHLVATNGLVPCLVELDARSQTSEASRTSSVPAPE